MKKRLQAEAQRRPAIKILRSASEDLAALDEMNLKQLQAKFLLLYEAETHSKNLTFLRRKLAWKLQEIREGGLSEKAKTRIEELRPLELPVRGSRTAQVQPPVSGDKMASLALLHEGPKHLRDERLPSLGTVLRRKVDGKEYEVVVAENGFLYDGCTYHSLSSVAKAITGTSWNGFVFWGLGERS